jgi:hypothetical protein
MSPLAAAIKFGQIPTLLDFEKLLPVPKDYLCPVIGDKDIVLYGRGMNSRTIREVYPHAIFQDGFEQAPDTPMELGDVKMQRNWLLKEGKAIDFIAGRHVLAHEEQVVAFSEKHHDLLVASPMTTVIPFGKGGQMWLACFTVSADESDKRKKQVRVCSSKNVFRAGRYCVVLPKM